MLKGLADSPNLDPFNDIDPITESDTDLYSQATSINKIQESSTYVSSESIYNDIESDDEWSEENEDIDNQSEIFLIVLSMKLKMFRQ